MTNNAKNIILFILMVLLIGILAFTCSIIIYGETQKITVETLPSSLFNSIYNALTKYGFSQQEALQLATEIYDYYYIQSNDPIIEITPPTIEITNIKISDETNIDTRIVTLHVIIKWVDASTNETIYSIEFDIETTINVTLPKEEQPDPPQYFFYLGIGFGYNFLNPIPSPWSFCAVFTMVYVIKSTPAFLGISIGIDKQLFGIVLGLSIKQEFYISIILGSLTGISTGFYISL